VGNRQEDKITFHTELLAKLAADGLVRVEPIGVDEVAREGEIRANLLASQVVQNELAHTEHFVVAPQK